MKEKNKPKCKEWERRRREKLNEAFDILAQLLPNYDPAKNLAKIDILERSTEFVKELRLSNSRLVSNQVETDEKCKLIKQLQDEVNKLILRVKQLTALLKTANINIPSGPFITSLGKKKLKWGGNGREQGEDNCREKVSDEENSLAPNIQQTNQISVVNSSDGKGTEEPTGQSQNACSTPLKEMNGPAQIHGQVESSTTSDVTLVGQKGSADGDASNVNESKSPVKRRVSSPTNNKTKVGRLSSKPNTNTTTTNTTFQPMLQSGTVIPLINSKAPITAVFTEPPKSTSATILPMQTIILTSSPNVINSPSSYNSSPVITRIAFGQNHQLLSQGMDGRMSVVLQKIPILPIRKPVPKIKWKRKRRKKILLLEVAATVSNVVTNSTSETISQIEAQKENDDDVLQKEKAPTHDENKDAKKIDSATSELVEEGEPPTTVSECEEIIQNTEPVAIMTELPTILPEVLPSKPCNKNANELMQIQLFAHDEPDHQVMEADASSLNSPPVLVELQSRKTSITETERAVSSQCSENLENKENKLPKTDHEKVLEMERFTTNENASPKSVELSINKHVQIAKPVSESLTSSQEISSKLTFNQSMSIMGQNENSTQEADSSINETVTTDKISECIARSMDLIDAPDGELMELGDNWGDTTNNSPKSPISPTQMFLNMFPLLPKENIVSTSEGNQIACSGGSTLPLSRHITANTGYSHRSFFIDSMLPEDNPVPVVSHNKHQSQSLGTIQYKNPALESEKTGKLSENSVSACSAKVTEINASLTSRLDVAKGTKIGSAKATTSTTVSKASEENRRHTYSGGQVGFKDLHLFSDSVDFSSLHTLPFATMADQDLFRESSSRSRGMFDPLFPLNIDQPPSSSADHFHLQHLNISENIQSLQFQINRDRIGSTENSFLSIGESCSTTPANQPKPSSSSNHTSTIHNLQNVANSNKTLPFQLSNSHNENAMNFGTVYSTPTTTTSTNHKNSLTPYQPNYSASKQLFRPQVHDMMETQSSSTSSTSSHILQPLGPVTKRPTSKVLPNAQGQLPPDLSKEQEKSSSGTLRGIQRNVDYFSLQRPNQSSIPQPQFSASAKISSSEKRKNSANQKKSRNIRESTPSNSFDGSSSNKERNVKENSKETSLKKSSGANKNIPCETMEDFHHFSSHQPQQVRNGVSNTTASVAPDIFTPLPSQTHMFGHPNQQTFDHNVNIFPDFSLPVDCNPHYDHYSMDFSFSSGGNPVQPQQFQIHPTPSSGGVSHIPSHPQNHHNQHVVQQPQPHHQLPPSNSRSSRPTPFYLQDVNCDAFNFEGVNPSHPPSHSLQQIHPTNASQNQTSNSSGSNLQSHQYNHTNSTSIQPPRVQTHQSTINPIPQNQNQQYFQTPSQSHQPHCQQISNYPNSNIPRQPGTTIQQIHSNSAPQNSRTVQIQQHPNQPVPSEQQIHSHYLNTQQAPIIIPKQVTPSISSVSHNNRTNVPQPSYSSTTNTNSNVRGGHQSQPPNVPSSASSSASSSHRPVNWMTDNSSNAFAGSNKQPNANSPTTTNPFSVSKLVGLGNNSGPGCTTTGNPTNNPNNKSQHPLNRQNSSGSSSNYCAEALIRKNPTTSIAPPSTVTTQIGWSPSSSLNNKPHQHHNFFHPSSSGVGVGQSTHPHQFNPHQTQTSQNTYNTNSNEHFTGYNFHTNPTSHSHPQNYESFENSGVSHHQHLHFQPHNTHQNDQIHHIHHPHNSDPQLTHNQGTSSVSNFNLSTIFPEINDKRQQQQRGPSSNNRTTSSSVNSLINLTGGIPAQNRGSSTGYYSQQPSHSQGRSK